jgi:hypothetical protein
MVHICRNHETAPHLWGGTTGGAQSASKEDRDAGKKMPIVGNVKVFYKA